MHALSLSTRRLPKPRYVQWMNQSGTLKIPHKARVKFLVENYVDSVDYDVAPMSACHLLLGRPWQFDLDATHKGRSNCYSFVHKGVHHILKPMKESDIKAHVFAGATRKKSGVHSTSKSRTTLVQEGENGVEIPTLNAAPSESVVSCKEPIQLGSISNILGKNVAMTKDTLAAKKVSKITVIKKPVEITPKPRTALFQGGENDEPIAPQDGQGDMSSDNSNIAAGNSLISSDLQFGAILFDEKYGKNMEKFTSAGLSSNILFRGVNCHNKEEEKKKRKYIYIGAMQVNVDD